MRKRILNLTAISLLLLGAVLAPNVLADEWNKKTIFTFSEPVQVPGAVLPAGTYVFKLADIVGNRNIVQIFNEEENRLLATILTIPDYRAEASDKTVVTFDERPSNQPQALRSWFYPGDNYGQEFVYPKQKAVELAQANGQSVPSIPDDVTEPTGMNTAPVTPVTDAPSEAIDTPAVPDSLDEPWLIATVVEFEELPQTASPLASVALLGVLCLAGAATFRRFSITGALKAHS